MAKMKCFDCKNFDDTFCFGKDKNIDGRCTLIKDSIANEVKNMFQSKINCPLNMEVKNG